MIHDTADNGSVLLSRKNLRMNTEPKRETNPLALEGLEALLDKAHLGVVATDNGDAIDSPEGKKICELLDQLHCVHEQLRKTSAQLATVQTRLGYLASVEAQQSQQLELLPFYRAHAAKASQLEKQVREIVAENEELKRSWWRKLFNIDSA
jgi:hypothetical protein